MLNYLRKNTKIICWFIVGCFIFWGVGSAVYSSLTMGQNVAGKVYGKKISYQEFNRHLKMVQLFGGPAVESKGAAFVEAQTWRQIALAMKARQKGIKVSDSEVRDEIIKRMQSPQGYTDDMYERWVQNVFRESPHAFEEKIRDLIAIQKLLNQIPLEMTISDEVLKKKYSSAHPDSKPEDFEKVKGGYRLAMIELLKLETKQKYIDQIVLEANIRNYIQEEKEAKEKVALQTPVPGGTPLTTPVPKPTSKEE